MSEPAAPPEKRLKLTAVVVASALFMMGVETLGRSLLPSGLPGLCVARGMSMAFGGLRRVTAPVLQYQR